MEPFVSLEEDIGKVVGKRKPPKDALMGYMKTADESRRWKAAFGTPHIPKGPYRFKTHEEADAWLWKMIARPRNK